MYGCLYLSRLLYECDRLPNLLHEPEISECHAIYHRPDIPDLNVLPRCRTPGCTSHTHPPSVPPGLYQIASFSSSAPPRHHQASRVCFFFSPQQNRTIHHGPYCPINLCPRCPSTTLLPAQHTRRHRHFTSSSSYNAPTYFTLAPLLLSRGLSGPPAAPPPHGQTRPSQQNTRH
jgi:hypothetical protein